MATPKFFIQGSDFQVDDIVVLPEDEHRHAMLSRRLPIGSEVILLNGIGSIATGRLVDLNKKSASVQVDKVEQKHPSRPLIRIASAIPKGDRQKQMLDMLTQVGVFEFIPLECQFSAVKVNGKMIQKWQRVVSEACKQSGNPFVTTVSSPLTVEGLIDSTYWQN